MVFFGSTGVARSLSSRAVWVAKEGVYFKGKCVGCFRLPVLSDLAPVLATRLFVGQIATELERMHPHYCWTAPARKASSCVVERAGISTRS